MYGSFDVVIDDGSHLPSDQIASIEFLWPHVATGGCYIVEDLHSNYWPEYGGGRGQGDTFIDWLRERIDDMHAFHSRESDFEVNEWTRTLGGVHVYDSVAVLVKAAVVQPEHRKTGRPAFDDVYGAGFHDVVDEQHLAQLASLSSPMARLRRLRKDPKGTIDTRLESDTSIAAVSALAPDSGRARSAAFVGRRPLASRRTPSRRPTR